MELGGVLSPPPPSIRPGLFPRMGVIWRADPNRREIFPNQGKIPLLSFSVPKISAIADFQRPSSLVQLQGRPLIGPGLAWPHHPFTHPLILARTEWHEHTMYGTNPAGRGCGVLPEGCSHG